MPITMDDLSDADVQALLDHLNGLENAAEKEKHLATINAILSTVAILSTMVERLERRAYLDEAALDSMAGALSSSNPLAKLRSLFSAPEKGVDIDEAFGRISELNNEVRSQEDIVKGLANAAKVAVKIAKIFI